jgi:hypothetical protein
VLRYKQLYLACFLCHFLFIFASGIRDTLSFVARGYTWLPVSFSRPAEKAERLLWSALGNDFDPAHPVRQGISIYTRLAGVESGYAFFAPNVPDNHKLVFEIHHADGRIEYDLPHVSSGSAGLRLVVLLDHLGETRSDELREVLIKMVAYTVWRRYPDATMIRAVFGFAMLPTAAEYRRGVRETDEFLYAYDFVFPPSPGPADAP